MSVEDDGVLERATGTAIDWKPGKDVTIKVMKKKPKKGGKADAKPQIKTEKVCLDVLRAGAFNCFHGNGCQSADFEMRLRQALSGIQFRWS
jgi:hypothetical protein